MRPIHLLSPGNPSQRTGGYRYNAALAMALEALGQPVRFRVLDGNWPTPDWSTPPGLTTGVPPGDVMVADGLLWTGLGAARAQLRGRNRTIVLVHSPLFRETGLAPAAATRLRDQEWAALREADAVVATGAPTLRDLPDVRAHCIVPGCDRPPGRPPRRVREGQGVSLLSVGTVTPRKAHSDLVEALSTLRALPWTLEIAGSLSRNPHEVHRLRARIDELDLGGRVRLLGELDDERLDAAYARADLGVHVARYEAWGMVLAEALVRGLPLVCTPAGALADVEAAAWVEAPVADPPGLAAVLAPILGDPGRLRAMERAAEATTFPTWADQAARFLDVVEHVRSVNR